MPNLVPGSTPGWPSGYVSGRRCPSNMTTPRGAAPAEGRQRSQDGQRRRSGRGQLEAGSTPPLVFPGKRAHVAHSRIRVAAVALKFDYRRYRGAHPRRLGTSSRRRRRRRCAPLPVSCSLSPIDGALRGACPCQTARPRSRRRRYLPEVLHNARVQRRPSLPGRTTLPSTAPWYCETHFWRCSGTQGRKLLPNSRLRSFATTPCCSAPGAELR